MKRLAMFLGAAGLFLVLWLLLAMCFDFAVAQVSYDYIPAARAGSRQTVTQGLFLCCLLAASCTASAGHAALGFRTMLAGAAVLPLFIGLMVTAAGVGCLILHGSGLLDDASWSLAFPRRHALYLGMELGYTVGAWVAVLAGCMWAWRARARKAPPVKS